MRTPHNLNRRPEPSPDPMLTMCRSRPCPLQVSCARHASSGAQPRPHQVYIAVPADLWDEAETAACTGWLLASDIE